jgi:glycosyltransferase involved in cell wall biosynthesis
VNQAQQHKQLIRIGVDVRDLRLASTGTKTYLDELLKVFRKLDGLELDLKEFNSIWKPYWGHSKWGKALEHVQFFIWKQFTLPLKSLFSNRDVLICTDYYVPLIKLKAKHLVVFHDALFFDHPEYYNPIWLKLFKAIALPAARRADVIIAPSQFSKERLLLHEKGFEGKIKVVYQGRKTIKEDAELSVNTKKILKDLNKQPYLLHIGVLEKRKNLAFLIKVIHEIRKTHDIKLLLVGRPNPKIFNNSEKEILSTIAELTMQEHVVFAGYVPDEDLPALYKQAKLYVFPSIYEGFGIPILEAFYYQVPVAVANNTCLPEIGGEGVSCFDPFDVEGAKNCLLKLLSDQDSRVSQIDAGNQLSHSFSWDKSAKEIGKIASEVVHLHA